MKKKRKANKKLTYLGMGGLILIITAFILVAGLRNSSLTGHSISVHSYGVSEYPMKHRVGSLQTVFELKQPTAMNMGEIQGGNEARLIVANEIVNKVNFPEGILEMYKKNPPSLLLTDAIKKISKAAKKENDNFRKDTTCLKKIGENLGHWGTLEVILVSELKYQRCNKNPKWLSAYVKHTFFNKEGNRFICSQEGSPLFLVNEEKGKVKSDTTTC